MKKINYILTIILLAGIVCLEFTLPYKTFAQGITDSEVTQTGDNNLNNEYKHNIATGSAKALAIRVGFSDYPLSDEESEEALTRENIASYFEDDDPSKFPYENIGAFYSRSSYNKLNISLGEIIDIQLDGPRDFYGGMGGSEAEYRLINDILSDTLLAQKLPEYDVDGDGTADFVYIFCNGANENKGSIWWPHCHSEGEDTFTKEGYALKDYVISCKTETNVLIHETGHLFGLPDLYSYEDYYTYDFSAPDMMNDNFGDHNGFSKWFAGWLSDENIVFVNKENTNADGISVYLSPLDSDSDSGNKIAVISPEPQDIYGEYFIVEYISGSGNMSRFDKMGDYPSGFRIIHVFYDFERGRFRLSALTEDNSVGAKFGVFEDGEEISAYTDPSSDFIENGEPVIFTGINISDFVTGEHPRFKVKFAHESEQKEGVTFTPSESATSNMLELTLNSDRPLKPVKKADARLEREDYSYPLVLKADEYNATKFYLEYRNLKNPLQPDTDYTLVLPEGIFETEDGELVPEVRLDLHTGKFTKIEKIESINLGDMYMRSGLVPFKGSSAYLAMTGNEEERGEGFAFVKFNEPSGDGVEEFFIKLPESRTYVNAINALLTKDGNYVVYIQTEKSTYVQKLSPDGEKLSDLIILPEIADIIETGGSYKAISTSSSAQTKAIKVLESEGEFKGDIWTFDFKNEPRKAEYRYDAYISGGFFPIGDEYYAVSGYNRETGRYYTDIYDLRDELFKHIDLSQNLPLSFSSKDDEMIAAQIAFDEDTGKEHFIISVYDMVNDTFTEKRLEGDNLDEMYFSGIKIIPSDWGYLLFYRYSGKTDNSLSKMIFLDREFKRLGSLTLPGGADCIPQSDRVVVVWEDDESRSMAWTEILLSDIPKEGGKESGKSAAQDKGNVNATEEALRRDETESADVKEVTGKEEDKEEYIKKSSSASEAAETGDENSIYLWGIAGGVVLVVMTMAVLKIKKRRNLNNGE